jgi:hypothetical protein
MSGVGLVEAYVRITLDGKTLYHVDPNIVMSLDPASFEGLAPEAVRSAVQLAMSRWNEVDHSALNFSLGADKPGADYNQGDHVIYYDADNSSGWFAGGSLTVAVTPIIYNTGDGKIIDIDVLFNGRRWNFDTQSGTSAFDIQDVLTHELGHVAGLDHSPVHGASMWPYVSPGQWLHRSLTPDDQSGAVAVARDGGIAQLRGELRRGDSSPIRGGAVGAVRALDGRLAAIALSDKDGDWIIKAVPPGAYHLYCFPVEGVTSGAELTSNGTVDTDFGAAFLGGTSSPLQLSLGNGQTLNVGTITAAADAAVRDNFGHATVLERGGPTQSVSIYGVNFNNGVGNMFEFSPYITLGSVSSDDGLFSAPVTVSPDCPPGSYDLFIELGNGELECVPGAIEVVDPAPQLISLSTTEASLVGGEWIEAYGDFFAAESQVLIGGRLAQEVRFIDSHTLQVRTPIGDGGDADVVVQNPDGQEDRIEDALRYIAIPVYEQIFPRAGFLAGGTKLRLVGSGFTPGMIVSVGGNSASYQLLATGVIEITTPAGDALGATSIRIESSEGHVEEQADIFTYVSTEDPDIRSFTPRSGKKSGGTEVNLYGDNLLSGIRVRFGVDPIDVQGGRYAGGVERLSEAELRLTTPSGAAGEFAVVVELPNGQGAIANSLFSYQPAASGGGCGGVVQGAQPGEPIDWLPLLLLALWWQRMVAAARRSAETKPLATR